MKFGVVRFPGSCDETDALSAAARVGWDPPAGARRTVETGTPTATIAELAGEFGGEIPGLTVTRPTLEDVYLDLIAAAGGDEPS